MALQLPKGQVQGIEFDLTLQCLVTFYRVIEVEAELPCQNVWPLLVSLIKLDQKKFHLKVFRISVHKRFEWRFQTLRRLFLLVSTLTQDGLELLFYNPD